MRSWPVLTGTVIAYILYIYFIFDYLNLERRIIISGMEFRFKYKINHFLSIQPRHITVDDVRSVLETRYGITQATFNRDRFIAFTDETEVPQERLDVYAIVLNVSTDQLTQASEPEIVYHVVTRPGDTKER